MATLSGIGMKLRRCWRLMVGAISSKLPILLTSRRFEVSLPSVRVTETSSWARLSSDMWLFKSGGRALAIVRSVVMRLARLLI